jgi:NADH-quinone oxidoreductase subunit M
VHVLLTTIVFLPVLAALAVLALPARWAMPAWAGASGAVLGLVLVAWATLPADVGGVDDRFAHEVDLQWIPSVDAGYHVGVDGLSLPLMAMTAVVFLACAVHSWRQGTRPRAWAALFLFLETASLGTFAALDLILFFLFFDLTIVGMYFVIAGWGHGEQARRSALLFFLYTFLGSLAMLVGFVVLFVGSSPRTFDIPALVRQQPLADDPVLASVALLAIGLGLAVKTPLVPVHTWLPPAHTDAPAEGSAVLAAVLLKLGTYGFVRIAMPVLPDAWQRWAWVVVVVGVVSVLWGALVALAQRSFKRMVAYTSVNHMGYVLLGLGAAGLVPAVGSTSREVAVTGAVLQMVSHGLLTGALFLLSGFLWERGGDYRFSRWGGLGGRAPRFAVLLVVAAFGSLGLPGLSGFLAEFHVFTGSFETAPVAVVVALLGVIVTAGLLLLAVQRLLTGEDRAPRAGAVGDVGVREAGAVGGLLVLSVLLGLFPAPVLEVTRPAVVALVLTMTPLG